MKRINRRGRPPLGNEGMVTVGVRVEPEERELLKSLAEECGQSLCAFVRELVRRRLTVDGAEDSSGDIRQA